jgi:hypothetical protein
MDQRDSYALEDDKLTRQKREVVKQRLALICGKEDDIDEILNSLEAYCLIVLNTIK